MGNYIVDVINQANAAAQGTLIKPGATTPQAPVKALGRIRGISADERQSYLGFASKGALIASQNPSIAAARALNSDGRFRWGFDIATGLCQGMSMPGPGQTAWRDKLGPTRHNSAPDGINPGSNEAMQGFDVGQALQHGITKSAAANEAAAIAAQPPNVAAGMLLANGIAGSGSPGDVKAGVISQTFADEGAKSGAATVIEEKKGFFAKLLQFFGL